MLATSLRDSPFAGESDSTDTCVRCRLQGGLHQGELKSPEGGKRSGMKSRSSSGCTSFAVFSVSQAAALLTVLQEGVMTEKATRANANQVYDRFITVKYQERVSVRIPGSGYAQG